MIYILMGIILYVSGLFMVKRGKEKRFSKYRKMYSYHNTRPYPKKSHYFTKKKKTAKSINNNETQNMNNLLRNEQMMEYMMWHNFWSNQ